MVSLVSAIPYVSILDFRSERAIGLCSSVIAAVFAWVLALYMNRLWRREGVRAVVCYTGVGLFIIFPPVARSIWLGETTMLFVLLVVAGWGFLTEWLKTFGLRDLAYAALLLGVCVGVRFQGLAIVALAGLVIMVGAVLERRSARVLEGTAVTFAVPALYMVLLWLGGNWLILGNPLFLFRGLFASVSRGALNLGSVVAANCEWGTLAAVGLVILVVPAAGVARATRGGLVPNLAAAAAAALMALLVWRAAAAAVHAVPPTPAPSPVRQVVERLERAYPNGSFIVLGYEGYEFAREAAPDPQRAWIHAMHLEPGLLRKVFKDFRGRRIYLLINTAQVVERWEDLGLEWRGERTRLPEGFLYVEGVGDWAVFECIRPDEPLLIGAG